MMKVRVNGEEKEFESPATLADLLRALALTPDTPGVALALNGQVIPRRQASETPIREGDQIEIVRAVQGG